VSTQNYNIAEFVNGVYNDLGNPSDYTTERITAWFLDNANIGKLNNSIGTDFSGIAYTNDCGNITGYGIEPAMRNDQLAIFKQLFEVEYYASQAQNFARSAAAKGSDWINLREADSSITRVNPNEIAKTFRAFYNDSYKTLKDSIKMYLKYNAIPDQVVGDDTVGQSFYIIQEYNRVTY
jgi:hypothetical protein